MDIVRDILTNVILLFGLIFIVGLTNQQLNFRRWYLKIINGIILGFVTIIIMLNAWEMSTGAIFDTRSVIISVSALFLSSVTSGIAALVAIIYRIHVGGDGVYAGVLTLFFSYIIGVLWKNFVHPKWKKKPIYSFYLFGLIVHIFMLLSQLTFPYPKNIEVLQKVGPIVIIVFPLAVMFIARGITNYQERLTAQELIKKSEEKYRTVVNNSRFGVIQYNTDGVIEIVNKAFADSIGTTQDKLMGLAMFTLPNLALVNTVRRSLTGEIAIYEDMYTSVISRKTFPVRAQFSPIYNKGEIVGGIAIIEDLTEQKLLEKNVQEMRTMDSLTRLLNRAAFDEFLFKKDLDVFFPITIATCDINTFQIINTSFGYDKGNEVLIEIAKILKATYEDNPVLRPYRIGGDEFALIMLNTSKEEAVKLIKGLRHQVMSMPQFDFEISISCGIATMADNEKSFSDVFNEALADMMANKIYDGSSISKKTIDLIMNTLFEKNKRERAHSERVSVISKKIAKLFSLGTAFTNRVALAGKLHDIGKIVVSEDILDKPGKLTQLEWLQIKKHPETGFKILSTVSEYLDVANVVLAHHEHYDGKGYPKGLVANESPLEARIIGVADAFDAMIVSRPYRAGISVEAAIEEIKRCSGTQFDPDVVQKIVELYETNELM